MLQFKNLQKHKNIIHGVLERKEGSANIFSDLENRNNILKVLKKLGYEARANNLIFAEQIHSSNVYFCPPDISGYIKFQVDGLISQTPGQILVIKTADCVPLLIYSPKEKKVAAIHAGSKGILKGIVEKAIKMFQSPPSLIIGIGPHIRNCCYWLRGEIKKSAPRKYIQKRDRKLYFDLTQIAIDKLLKSGVKKENIEDCGICTFCQYRRFYSARKMETQKELSSFQEEKLTCFGNFIGLK